MAPVTFNLSLNLVIEPDPNPPALVPTPALVTEPVEPEPEPKPAFPAIAPNDVTSCEIESLYEKVPPKLSTFEENVVEPEPPLPKLRLILPIDRPLTLAFRVPQYTPFPACGYEVGAVKYELRQYYNNAEPWTEGWLWYDKKNHLVRISLSGSTNEDDIFRKGGVRICLLAWIEEIQKLDCLIIEQARLNPADLEIIVKDID